MLTRKVKVRMATFFVLLGVAIFFIIVRLVHVQIFQHDRLANKANGQYKKVVSLQPNRGVIYDRKQRELAVSVAMESVYGNPREIKNPMEVAMILSNILETDDKKILEKLTGDNGFVWIERRIDSEKANRIKSLNIPGVGIIEEPKRFYPKKELASHILGFVGLDDSGLENKGLEGIEYCYDQYIRGTPGLISTEKDAMGRNISSQIEQIAPATDGKSIVLTIDEVIQHITERELEKGVEKFKPNWAMAIVMDPKTFEILAMANWPNYNPNTFHDYPKEVLKNRAVTDLFEPGSSFKVSVMSGLLEDGIVEPTDKIYCENGAYLVYNHLIHDSHTYDTLTFKRAIEVSSNIAIIKSVQKWSPKRLYQYLCSFGFGKKTDIDLPGEVSGTVPRPENWSKISIGAVPIGQEVGVTGIQLIQPIAVIANNGVLMQPYVVKSIIDEKGVVREFKPKAVRRVISEDTVRKAIDILEGAVKSGTCRRAAVPGYRVAGKTGTAKKYDPEIKKYSFKKLVVSFVGFAPVNDPRVCILVVMDEPKSEDVSIWGETVACPVAKEILREVLRYLNIPQDKEQLYVAEETVMPDLIGMDIEKASKILVAAGLDLVRDGTGEIITDQKPKPGAGINSGSIVKLYFAEKTTEGDLSDKILMPKLLGLTIRQVLRVISNYQLDVKFEGSGRVVKQEPLPGTPIKKFQRSVIYFSDQT